MVKSLITAANDQHASFLVVDVMMSFYFSSKKKAEFIYAL